ncbi:hypothetical protein ACHAQH_010067 [Verticillium albo-atrum]
MAPVIFIPLYIYPFETAWEPLLRSAAAHPSLTFVAVVNPGNGPGPDPRPDASYVAALRRLCALPNIQLLGYVHVTYCTRDPSAVERDIAVYRAWNDDAGDGQGSFRVEGIFFDETPWDPCHQAYMAGLARFTRDAWRSGLDQRAVLAYNPGVVVEPRWFSDADYVLVFEQSARHWAEYFEGQGLPQIPPALRPKAVAVVHTCGGSGGGGSGAEGGGEAGALARRIDGLGFGGVYLTDEVDGGYTRWPVMWKGVLETLVSSMTAQQKQQKQRRSEGEGEDSSGGCDRVQGPSVQVKG